MAYDVMTVTLKGVELLASATTADRLIIAGCDATTTFITKANAVNVSSRPASPFSTSTNAQLEKSTANHVFIRVFFVAGQSTGGDVRSLYVYGHKESDPTNDYVLAVLSSENTFHLPEVGDISNTYGTLVDIIYNPAEGSVSSVTASVYATYGEYADLRDRSVTCHKRDLPTTGDNQTIYGEKTFKNTIKSDVGSLDILTSTGGLSGTDTITLSGIGTALLSESFPETRLSIAGGGDYHRLKLDASEKQGAPFNTEIRNFGLYSSRSSAASNVLSKVECIMEKPAIVGGGSSNGSVNIYAKKEADPTFAQIQVITKENSPSGSVSKIALTSSEGTGSASAAIEIQSENDGNDGHDAFINLNVEGTLRNSCTSYLSFSSGSTKIISSENGNNYENYEFGSVEVGTDNFVSTKCGVAGLTVKDENGVTSTVVLTEYSPSAIPAATYHALYPIKASNDGHLICLGTLQNKWDVVYANSFVGAVFDGGDKYNNPLTNYILTANLDGTTISFANGDHNQANAISLNEPITEVLQGKKQSSDSIYSQIGAIGLFYYRGSSGYPITGHAGDTVLGSLLSPACLVCDTDSQSVPVSIKWDSSVTLSGTWRLLSFLYRSDGFDDCLVMAVKTGNN